MGKHTVSRKLAEILGYEIVDVNKEAVKVGTAKQNDSVDVEFHEVDKWRGRAEDKKQGSDEENTIEWVDRNTRTGALQLAVENIALTNYKRMLDAGVAPEQARMILPQSMMTEWYWSGTLYAFARVCNLRCASDAQYETRIVANLINKECSKLFPISWTELRNT